MSKRDSDARVSWRYHRQPLYTLAGATPHKSDARERSTPRKRKKQQAVVHWQWMPASDARVSWRYHHEPLYTPARATLYKTYQRLTQRTWAQALFGCHCVTLRLHKRELVELSASDDTATFISVMLRLHAGELVEQSAFDDTATFTSKSS